MEILAWVSFAAFVKVIPAYIFPIAGGAQIWVWAGQKKGRLAKEYPEVKKRGRITPFAVL
jgi:hypothetical protein